MGVEILAVPAVLGVLAWWDIARRRNSRDELREDVNALRAGLEKQREASELLGKSVGTIARDQRELTAAMGALAPSQPKVSRFQRG